VGAAGLGSRGVRLGVAVGLPDGPLDGLPDGEGRLVDDANGSESRESRAAASADVMGRARGAS
jgi:cytolysin (calcineurin-like family phosphatase)